MTGTCRDRRLVAGAWIALMLANARYWLTVAPLVRRQLARWERRARAIDEPALRTLASEKLREERFNAEAAAILATLAPRRHRACAVEAIVALEVLFDYLDSLTESLPGDPLQEGRELFGALADALAPSTRQDGERPRHRPRANDGGYLEELSDTVSDALSRLPAIAAVSESLQRSAARGAEAQVRAHAAARIGDAQLEEWARAESAGTGLHWREFLAGAKASVLGAHALIAAAADRRTTYEQAVEIDRLYLSIGVLPTVLDSLIDYERDARRGRPGYVRDYADRTQLAGRLARVVRDAATRARATPNGAHHVMILAGVVAYYTTAPTAKSEFARPVAVQINLELRPLITPALAMMRAWRAAKCLHGQWQGRRPTTVGEPV